MSIGSRVWRSRPTEPTLSPRPTHDNMDMDPSREDSEEKMKEAFEQLERDFDEENWERRKRKWNEKRKEERTPEEAEKWKKEVVEPAYEKLQAEVKRYDDGMVAGYKEDIDTLLVFAGLFSAVVTAFLIESYQWLQEDPQDTTVVILTQIFHQLNASSIQEPEPFTPDASSIRINCFWFLSLIFSLTSALFGLLCKQWLREHQRDVPTRTPGEDLALQQLRRDSFEKWGVASFLSALPILLQIAVIFFFVGVLDLLWTLQPIVFSICLAAISLSVGLYFLTTILPTITIPRDQAQFISTWDSALGYYRHDFGQLAYQFICPYKSPQAWAVYKLLTTLPKPLLRFPLINVLTKTHLCPLWDHMQTQTSSWSMFDLRVVRQFDEEVIGPFPPFRLQVYELRALQWAVTMFRDSPSIIPHLENVLKSLHPTVAISAVLDRWGIAMWEGRLWDVGTYLHNPDLFVYGPKPITSDLPLYSQEGIELLFQHRLLNIYVDLLRLDRLPSDAQGHCFASLEQEISSGVLTQSKSLRFYIPLPLATALWSHKDSQVRQKSLRLLQHFEHSWNSSPGYDKERHNEERVAFANAIVVHIVNEEPPSVLLTSKRGQAFIRFIWHEIIIRRLYSHDGFYDWLWRDAIKMVQEVGKLPDDYFAPLPQRDEDPPPTSQLPQLEPIRYTIDTIRSQSDNPRDKVPEMLPSPANDVAERIDIQVHGSHGNTTSGVANLGDDALISGSAGEGRVDSVLQAIEDIDGPSPSAMGMNDPVASRKTSPGVANSDRSEASGAQVNNDVDEVISSPIGGDLPGPSTSYNQGHNIGAGGRALKDQEEHASESMDAVPPRNPKQAIHRVSHPGHRGQEAGDLRSVGSLGRVGWNPTNDPNVLRVRWFC